MPPAPDNGYPDRDHVIDYLRRYERRYDLPVKRPVKVERVIREGDHLRFDTDRGAWWARAVISATGTWRKPFIPSYPGREIFEQQIHSACYHSPELLADRRVLIVGGGNSGAQILAEVSLAARLAVWVTLQPPRFLPDDVDGRVLFERATDRWRALQEGRDPGAVAGLGDIVMVAPVRDARERGVLGTVRPLARLTRPGVVWADGTETAVDAVIWCTGFRPALDHLVELGVVNRDGRVDLEGTRSVAEPRLWLIGHGEWTGFASATLIGVTRTARSTVDQVAAALAETPGRSLFGRAMAQH